MDRSKDVSTQRSIDFLQLDGATAPAGGLTDWLTGQLRVAVADGRLAAGDRLPASRVLAEGLGVSRGVVTEAYRRLAEDGAVAGRGRGGTVVVGGLSAPRPAATAALGADAFELLRVAPSTVDLSPGLPDLAAFPRGAWLRAERAVLSGLSPETFGYGDPRGAPAFRAEVARWLARNRGIRVDPAEVIVVAGVAQALALLARTLLAGGVRAIAVEDPGSLGARKQLQSWGLGTPPVAVDGAGLRVDELTRTGAPAVMLTPAHQFPTGVVLDGARRRELRAWIESGGLVIEDDYDAEHRYDRPPVPALRAGLADGVAYAGSVSKLLAPALRVGWLLVPDRYREAVVAAKRDTDLGNAVLAQLVLAQLMRTGELERQLRFFRRRHRRRRDAMIAALASHLPHATVHGAAAGLHLMITLGAGVSDVDIAAAALRDGVKLQPLSWHRQRPGPPGLVLGYAASSPTQIEAGIATLGRLIP